MMRRVVLVGDPPAAGGRVLPYDGPMVDLDSAYSAVGRGREKSFTPVFTPELALQARDLSSRYPEKQIAVIAVDKRYVHQTEGIRMRNVYYYGEPTRVTAALFRAGEQSGTRVLHEVAG